jgi:site-specific DNA-methyltransferase (adenine-specific)
MDFKFIKGDCLELMKDIPDGSVNCVLSDPPYKYLKNQKLEVDFDEVKFFNEAKRILKKDGFIVLFGRGTSFYRWNTMLADLKFVFKEEIIWNKEYTTSPVHPLSRTHETISIHGLKQSKINISRIPYNESKDIEGRGCNLNSIIRDIKRISSGLNNPKSLQELLLYIESGTVLYNQGKERGSKTTVHGVVKEQDRAVKTLQAITTGLKEKTIITINRDHYATIHPTQKPARLIERLLAITTKEGDLVLDPFAGSCSTGVACKNTNRSFIGFELDEEYYNDAVKRIRNEADLFFNPGSIEPCAESIAGMPSHGLHL